MKLADITVVVPTRNEQENILPFLRSLPPQISLIVVDDSQDNTPNLIESHRPARTLVLRRPGNISQARQVGCDCAQTRWLLFTDADVTFAPDYFERLTTDADVTATPNYLERLIRYRGYSVIYGPKLSLADFSAYYRWFTWGQHLSHRLGIPAASGSNLLIERYAFQAVGGFDLGLNCNEDSEIVWRIKRRGYRVLFDPGLIVYARDHRRLRAGLLRKTTHSVFRSLLLYLNLIPARWRHHDWGYWSHSRSIDVAGPNPAERMVSHDHSS
jgi:glycosyltransferase involved in cell wall biosynthesis